MSKPNLLGIGVGERDDHALNITQNVINVKRYQLANRTLYECSDLLLNRGVPADYGE